MTNHSSPLTLDFLSGEGGVRDVLGWKLFLCDIVRYFLLQVL